MNDRQIHQDSPLPEKIRLSQQVIISGFEYRIRQDSPQPASNCQWIRVPEAGNRIPPALLDPVDPDPVLGSCPALVARDVLKIVCAD
ncbi:hypothetical protein E2C01_084077 [Portunus trituberculatus]|uniref:Uncharacterized protein n=1 Tax=Portunus trituberculatus TaxID=210409 RepID=A0A5B7J9Q5_PORTR|nr:hypothetical protein [Portunus trituberculatus]